MPAAQPRFPRLRLVAFAAVLALAPASLFAAFGLSNVGGHYVVDTGAGLVFKINESNGDLTSLVYNGVELQDPHKFSGVSSGLGSATVTATRCGSNLIKIACVTPTLTHYYLARSGCSHVYLATYVTAEPEVGELRYIFRLSTAALPGAPAASDLRGTTGAIESKDIFGLPNGETRSKYYGKARALELDAAPLGVTGRGVAAFMIFGNREKSSGGPFFRDIQHQTGAQTEVYNYMNSGHNQTEPDRMGFHGPYALVVTNGTVPNAAAIDFSWFDTPGLNLSGYVPAAGRGRVQLDGISGRDPAFAYTVGFANPDAQYWTTASPATGACVCAHMLPGTYAFTIYKGELAVDSGTVTVTAGGVARLPARTITADPSMTKPLWRIGEWDGTPLEFKNGPAITTRHPSDVRNESWGPVTYAVGAPARTFPAAQWRTDANSPTTITFNLTASQIKARTLRIGITSAHAGGRPEVTLNEWTSPMRSSSSQPHSRSLTIGTYRGDNACYTFAIPADALVAGVNTLKINIVSGSGGTGFLSPGFSYDCVDFY